MKSERTWSISSNRSTRSFSRRAQGAVQAGPHVADQQAGDEGNEEEEEDPADDEARRWRHRGEAGKASDHDVEQRDDDRRGERARQAEPDRRGNDQQVEEQRKIGWRAVPAGEIENAGRDQEVDGRGEKAKPAPRFVASHEDHRHHQVDQAPAEKDGVDDEDRGLGVPVAEVVEDDGGGQHHPPADHGDPLRAGQDGRLAVADDDRVVTGGRFGPVRHSPYNGAALSCLSGIQPA